MIILINNMRRIKSKHEQEKKQKKNQLIIGIILIFVMFGSVFGIIVNSFGKKNQKNNLNYNGYEFIYQEGYWYTSLGNLNLVFKYHPNQTKDSNESIDSFNKYQNLPLYIYSENNEASLEISRNLGQISERMQPACVNETKCFGDYPIKTCQDNFIIIQKGENKLEQKENCIYIQGNESELTKLTDEFLFRTFKIKN